MILDDIEGPLCTLFQNTCLLSLPRKFERRKTHTISDDDLANDPTFWRYKVYHHHVYFRQQVYADIRGGTLDRGRQTTVG